MHNTERMADLGMLSSFFLWLTARALEWMPILQATSLTIAILAGALAAVVHGMKIWDRMRGNQ